MYAYCYLQKYPVIQPFARRVLLRYAQRVEGVCGVRSEDNDEGENTHRAGVKRVRSRSHSREIRINGLESLQSAFVPAVKDAEVIREPEVQDMKQARAETADALGKAAQTIMTSVRTVREMAMSA